MFPVLLLLAWGSHMENPCLRGKEAEREPRPCQQGGTQGVGGSRAGSLAGAGCRGPHHVQHGPAAASPSGTRASRGLADGRGHRAPVLGPGLGSCELRGCAGATARGNKAAGTPGERRRGSLSSTGPVAPDVRATHGAESLPWAGGGRLSSWGSPPVTGHSSALHPRLPGV